MNCRRTLAHGIEQLRTGWSQDDAVMQTADERNTKPRLEEVDLVAHRRLDHAQLRHGGAEIQMPAGCLEHEQRIEWRQLRKALGHYQSLYQHE